MQTTHTQTPNSKWKSLYLIGGAAALVAAIVFRRNLSAEYSLLREMGALAGPAAAPETAAGWFTALRDSPLAALTLLNLFDIVNYALAALIILGLYAALRKISRGWMTLAAALAWIAFAAYLASNQAFGMLYLSGRYYAAAGDAERAVLQSSGEALLAIHNTGADYGHGIYPAFLLVNLAGLIGASVMLRSPAFGKPAAVIGMIAHVLELSYYAALVAYPPLIPAPISLAAVFLLIWYILVGLRLLRLGLQPDAAPSASSTAA